MKFNPKKCYSMRVTHKKKPILKQYFMGDCPLQEVEHHPYLGVELSSNMSWNKHINKISTKANRMLGLLKRNLSSCSQPVKDVAYKTLVRPTLEYCNTIWDPYQLSNITTIDKVQRRAARFVLKDYSRTSSVTNMLNKLDWDTLKNRRVKARLCLFYKETHGQNHQPITVSSHTTRQSSSNYTYSRIPTNKNCFLNSLYPRTIPEWNALPDHLRSAKSVTIFKTQLDNLNISNLSMGVRFKN